MLLRYASESDRAGLANVNIGAFEGSLFLTNTFPQASPEGLRFFKGVMALRHLADPAVHVLVTVDDANAVLGYCRWKIPRGIGYDQEPVPLSQEGSASLEEPFRFAPRPMNEDMYNGFKRLMEETRKRHTTEDDFSMFLLVTSSPGPGGLM